MSTHWNHLRGEDLSAFAASPQAINEEGAFAQHLEQYATALDFVNWIEQKEIPLLSALKVFADCPHVAQPWLMETMRADTHPNSHYAAAIQLAIPTSTVVSSQAKDVLNSLNYAIIPTEGLKTVCDVLLVAKVFDTIERHWTVFNTVAQADPQKFLIRAASVGMDLHDQLGPPLDPVQYFRVCVAGGLLGRVQQYSPDPSQIQAVTQAFTVAALRYADNPSAMAPIMQYLWDAYPNQPWHTVEETLGLAAYAPKALAQKIAVHYHTHAPDKLKMHAEGLTAHAIYAKKKELFDAMFPHVDPSEHSKVFYSAIHNRRKAFLTTLLTRTTDNGHAGFFEALEKCTAKDQQWAKTFYATRQKTLLQSKIHNKREAPGVVQHKKM